MTDLLQIAVLALLVLLLLAGLAAAIAGTLRLIRWLGADTWRATDTLRPHPLTLRAARALALDRRWGVLRALPFAMAAVAACTVHALPSPAALLTGDAAALRDATRVVIALSFAMVGALMIVGQNTWRHDLYHGPDTPHRARRDLE